MITIKNILEAVEQNDVEFFTTQVYEFDKLTKLDNWRTTILLRIKKGIVDESSLT